MNDGYFRQILGVPPQADRDQIRKAYRRLVMENHPDRFPPEKKPLQDLAVITLTEAYTALMSAPGPHAAESPAASVRGLRAAHPRLGGGPRQGTSPRRGARPQGLPASTPPPLPRMGIPATPTTSRASSTFPLPSTESRRSTGKSLPAACRGSPGATRPGRTSPAALIFCAPRTATFPGSSKSIRTASGALTRGQSCGGSSALRSCTGGFWPTSAGAERYPAR